MRSSHLPLACAVLLAWLIVLCARAPHAPRPDVPPAELLQTLAARRWLRTHAGSAEDDPRFLVYCDGVETARGDCRYCDADRERARTSCTVVELEAIDGWKPVAWTLNCPTADTDARPCDVETYAAAEEIE